MSNLNGHTPLPIELDIPAEKEKILNQIMNWISKVKDGMDSAEDDEGRKKELSAMPAAMNSDIDQLKQKALLIKAAEFFDDKLPGLKWFSPDNNGMVKIMLHGKRGSEVVISAMINAQAESADESLHYDLHRLRAAVGEKFYVVSNEAMHTAAYNIMHPEANIIYLKTGI